MWNIQKHDILKIYNLLYHPLRNKYITIFNIKYKITNVFKEWSSGWYYSLELENPNQIDSYIKIPFKNLNSDDESIIKKIDYFNNIIKWEETKNGPCSIESSTKA